jgi:hypothetical protein
MGLPGPRSSDGHHIAGLLDKRPRAQPRDLLADERRKAGQLQRLKGLVAWHARLPQVAFDPPLFALFPFEARQFVQERFMAEAGAGRLNGDLRDALSHGREFEPLQQGRQFRAAIAHAALPVVNS